MKRKILLGLAPLGFLLSGCVTAVQDELQKSVASSEASIRADTCPERAAPLGEMAMTMRTAPAAEVALASLPALGVEPTDSPIEAGRKVIELAAQPDKRALLSGYLLNSQVNFAVFSGKLDDADEAGADLAVKALNSRGLAEAKDLQSVSGRAGDGPVEVSLSRESWAETASLVKRATMENGWTAEVARTLGNAVLSRKAFTPDQALEFQRKALVAAYMIAYFRNGEVFTVNFDDDALTKQIKADLKDKIKDDGLRTEVEKQIDVFAKALEKELCQAAKADSCRIMGVLGETTFVTRAGASHAFTGLNVTVDVTKDDMISTNKLDPDVIAPDLVRVVIEGLGDQMSSVPGVKNSTLCTVLPARCAGSSENEKKMISRVNDVGDRTEAGTAAAVGAAIRGGWLISLNNETVAATVTTGAAVAARKAAEAATWKIAASGGACKALIADKKVAYRQIIYKLKS